MLLLVSSAHVQTPPLVPRLPYDPLRDFTPIMQIAYYPLVLCVLPGFPAQTFAEFLAYAKARPGEVTMASSGIGNTPHLAAALLGLEAGIEFTHVQYNGTSTAQTALLGGEVKAMFQNPVLAVPAIRAGRLRAVATTGAARWREVPEVATVAESGFPGFEAGSWFGVMGPAGIAPKLAAKLHEDIRAVMELPEVRARLTGGGFDLLDAGPAEFRAVVERDLAKWAQVIRTAGIRAE
jgi:tripartite-type tricarboxylate transporter receptor subunit TctC